MSRARPLQGSNPEENERAIVLLENQRSRALAIPSEQPKSIERSHTKEVTHSTKASQMTEGYPWNEVQKLRERITQLEAELKFYKEENAELLERIQELEDFMRVCG
jgi:hypothetical protein